MLARLQRRARMVGDDADHLHVQLADPHPVEQVDHAMVEHRHQDQHLPPLIPPTAASSPARTSRTSSSSPAAKASTGASSANPTRMKNLPVSASSNCAASMMSPPCRGQPRRHRSHDPGPVVATQGQHVGGHRSPWLAGRSLGASTAFRENCTIGSREVRRSASTAGADEEPSATGPRPGWRPDMTSLKPHTRSSSAGPPAR